MSVHRKAIVDAFRDGYEGSLADLAWQLSIPSREVRHVVNPLTVAGFIVLPTTMKEFAQYLRDLAEQVDRIPDRPLYLNEQDVEIGPRSRRCRRGERERNPYTPEGQPVHQSCLDKQAGGAAQPPERP